jgi:glycosyltransferase involved in cell wall biosynthesis
LDLGRDLRGGQHQVLLLLKTLRKAGHSGSLLARAGSPLFESAAAFAYPVLPASLLTLRRVSAEFDIVHAHDAHAHTWAAIASRRPFVVSRRVAFPVGTSALSTLKYRRAARFLAVSSFVASKLQQAGVPQSKIDIVYDSVELPAFMPAWNPKAPVIALASFDPQKGRDLIERASEMAHIPIHFSTDLAAALAHASAFVYISRSEGFGSAALLAMSYGVPVIASRIDGMAEVFEDGQSGIFVDNDASSIAHAIQRLAADPALAQAIIENARRRVEEVFSTSRLLTGTLAGYRRALAL